MSISASPRPPQSKRSKPCSEQGTTGVTNRLALILAIGVVVAIGYDALFWNWANTLFVARKGLDLLEWIAFWR